MMTDKCPVCSGSKMASMVTFTVDDGKSLIMIPNSSHPIGTYYEKK